MHPPQICADTTLQCAEDLPEGRATVPGKWQAARMDPGESQGAQRQMQAPHPHPGQLEQDGCQQLGINYFPPLGTHTATSDVQCPKHCPSLGERY